MVELSDEDYFQLQLFAEAYSDTPFMPIIADILEQSNDSVIDAKVTLPELRKWVIREIEKIESDERFHYERAPVHINAPLALIQVEMDTRRRALRQILKQLEFEVESQT